MNDILGFDWEKPDGINEMGVKFWKDKFSTDYAVRPDSFGTSLDGCSVVVVETPDGYRTRLIVDDRQNVLGENQSLEGIGCQIDVMKLLKRDKEREKIACNKQNLN